MRLIDAYELEKWLKSPAGFRANCEDCTSIDCLNCIIEEAIDNAPTIEAAPVVHGWWEDVKETSLYVPDMKYTVTHTAETCSACKVRIGFIGSKPYLYDNICPNCGARMDGEGNV